MRSLPLAGRRIVVTRPADQAHRLTDRLRALGAEPLSAPAIRTRPSTDPVAVAMAVRDLDRTAWVVFTSANGVRYAWPFVEAAWPSGLPDGLRVAAIGPHTAQALNDRGVQVDFVPDTYVAEAVTHTLPVEPGTRVLLLNADIARRTLPDGLDARGVEVQEVTAYHTVPGAEPAVVRDVLSQDPNAVAFTSSSTVHGFAQALPDGAWPKGVHTVAIGPVTAQTLRDLSLPVDAVARVHTIDGLLDALIQLYS